MGIRICVDTNLFLNVKNKEKLRYKHSKKVLEAIDDGRAEGIVPTVVVAELCAGYYEFNQLKEKDEFLTQLATNPNYEIIDLDLRIANEAGRIRAATGLHTNTARKLLPLGMERNCGTLSRRSPGQIVETTFFCWAGSGGEDASA